MSHLHFRVKIGLLAAVFTGFPCIVNAQSGAVPDAQVEANVLRQLASAPELSTQNIQSTTVYGTVTLSGNVHSEELRSRAENLAARAQGVKKVVDELTLGDGPAANPPGGDSAAQAAAVPAPAGEVLQSDGSYAPAQPGDVGQAQASLQTGAPQAYPQGQTQPAYPQNPNDAQQSSANQPTYGQPQYPGPGQQPGYSGQPGYTGDQRSYGNTPSPAPYGQAPPQRQPLYRNGYAPYPDGQQEGGQVGGQQVTVAGGTVLHVRIDRGFDANHVIPGTPFSGIVMNDVVAGGAIAIPRGATVQGTVVDARKAGVLKGEAELGLQINDLALGGRMYPFTSDVWQREGRDKTVGTVNSALGLGALGAVLGAVAGGGEGAAIGAGVGGAAGIAGSAASPNGRVIIPAEAVLSFQLAQPLTVTTVGQAELSRLSYAAGPASGPRPLPRRRYYNPDYGYYYGPRY